MPVEMVIEIGLPKQISSFTSANFPLLNYVTVVFNNGRAVFRHADCKNVKNRQIQN